MKGNKSKSNKKYDVEILIKNAGDMFGPEILAEVQRRKFVCPPLKASDLIKEIKRDHPTINLNHELTFNLLEAVASKNFEEYRGQQQAKVFGI